MPNKRPYLQTATAAFTIPSGMINFSIWNNSANTGTIVVSGTTSSILGNAVYNWEETQGDVYIGVSGSASGTTFIIQGTQYVDA